MCCSLWCSRAHSWTLSCLFVHIKLRQTSSSPEVFDTDSAVGLLCHKYKRFLLYGIAFTEESNYELAWYITYSYFPFHKFSLQIVLGKDSCCAEVRQVWEQFGLRCSCVLYKTALVLDFWCLEDPGFYVCVVSFRLLYVDNSANLLSTAPREKKSRHLCSVAFWFPQDNRSIVGVQGCSVVHNSYQWPWIQVTEGFYGHKLQIKVQH